MLTKYQSEASGSFHCSLTEREFRATQTKATLFRGEGEDTGMLQHRIVQTQERSCHSNCALCAFVCFSISEGNTVKKQKQNDELKLTCVARTLDDSLESGCHSNSHSSFQFHYHPSVQIALCLHLSWEQISTWDEHR